ncbi:nucleotidyl transferase AbiEii/AbiGii toxin family protein [Stigmatella aurantiaca]|nr:nucleotidyl transferase AbiEii/AbiGii toxin family protein [Stigmatella aurantiaca]
MTSSEASTVLAKQVWAVLQRYTVDAVVIGGVALAAHNYPRSTDDLDLGVIATRATLRAVYDEFLRLGYTAELREPDGDDPLGGVIDVEDKAGGFVQIVNFDNSPSGGFPRVIRDALQALGPPISRLPIAPLPHIIAMKLYAGGDKSRRDIQALVRNNPDEDWEAIRTLCKSYNLDTYGLF